MKRLFKITLAIALLVGLALPVASTADQPKRGGTLTMATRKDLTTMNPLVTTRSTDRSIRDLMFEPLVGIDLKGKIQPYLAESWDISKDGRLYTFHLRKGVKFHDGREMTAQDAKYAIDYSMNPKNGAYGLTRLRLIESVETPDKYTLKLSIKKASPAFLTQLTTIGAFSVIPKESLQEGGTRPDRFPPGTGPFKFVEWKSKQRMVFDRFDEYWGQKANVDRVILRPIANSTVRFTALRAGDVDIVERAPYEWVRAVADGKIKNIDIVKAPYAGFRRLYFNVADPPFNNKQLRQAVAHAMNKKEILSAAYFGFGETTDQKYPRGHTWYIDGVPSPSYDLEKAKALLEQSGYKKGKTLTIMLRQGEDQATEATVLQAQLKKIGLKVKLDVLDYGSYTDRQRRGDYSFMFFGGGYDPDPTLVYGPDLTCVNPKRRISNVAAYCNKEVEALVKKAETEMDPTKRKALFKKIVTQVSEDLPFIPVGYVPRFFTVRTYVKGFTTDAGGAFRPWGGGLNHVWLDKMR